MSRRTTAQPIPQADLLRGTTMYAREGARIGRCAQCLLPVPEQVLSTNGLCAACNRPSMTVPSREQVQRATAESIRRRFPRNSSRAKE